MNNHHQPTTRGRKPNRRTAHALLLLERGVSPAEAARRSGVPARTLRYHLDRVRVPVSLEEKLQAMRELHAAGAIFAQVLVTADGCVVTGTSTYADEERGRIDYAH